MRVSSLTIAMSTSLLIGLSSTAHAGFNYGNIIGNDYSFLQVSEDSTSDASPLYGAPLGAANSLVFSPSDFESQSSGLGGSESTNGTLTTTITSNAGAPINQIIWTEGGDYTLLGNGGVGTSAAVSAQITITILEVNGAAITPIVFNDSLTFNPSDGDFNLFDDGVGIAQLWSGAVTIDVLGILSANGISGSATAVQFELLNLLETSSEAGTSALIAKKDLGTVITIIPSPGVVALLGVGGLIGSRRRRC